MSFSCVYDAFSSNNDFKASVFTIGGVPERCRSLTSNSPALKRRNQYLQVLWDTTPSSSTDHIDLHNTVSNIQLLMLKHSDIKINTQVNISKICMNTEIKYFPIWFLILAFDIVNIRKSHALTKMKFEKTFTSFTYLLVYIQLSLDKIRWSTYHPVYVYSLFCIFIIIEKGYFSNIHLLVLILEIQLTMEFQALKDRKMFPSLPKQGSLRKSLILQFKMYCCNTDQDFIYSRKIIYFTLNVCSFCRGMPVSDSFKNNSRFQKQKFKMEKKN
uniref:Transmembrane protein n=1 Tax=Heterorhabditis bacteriophora TaxID=37862 RepID=A0A1I7W8G2_HETBA